jgi:cytochrome c biogenesis protein CcmG/thiol:disulfide interchange protein DsbE
MRSQAGPVVVGSAAPDFVLTTFDGEIIRSQDLRGTVVLVNFWASWCRPCEQEAPALEQTWRSYRERGVLFLGVDYVDTEPDALRFLERFSITYPNGPDLGTRMAQQFRIRGVPETFIIDGDGRITFVKISPFASESEIRDALEIALAP